MAVAAAAFNATFIALANIYTDEYSTRQDTNVYSNGVMQVNIFLSVDYREDATGIESQIIEYVQNNSVIYVLENDSPLTWVKSTKSNGYYHNIDSESQKKDQRDKSDIRVPLYFTVPVNSEGTYRWVAKLGDQETNTNTPVTVNVHEYYVTPSDFIIDDITSHGCATLRVLRYQHGSFEDKQKLIRCLEYKGLMLTSANSYISMIMSKKGHKAGAFLTEENSAAKVALNNHEYDSGDWHVQGVDDFDPERIITSKYGWEDPPNIPVSDIQDAWNKGIPMMKIAEDNLYIMLFEIEITMSMFSIKLNREMQGFLLEDNFGNRVEVDMNWDVNDWWGNWAVSKATVKYP